MFSSSKKAESGPSMGTTPTVGGTASRGGIFGSLGHLLPNDKSINPSDVYAISGEQLMQALQTAIAVGLGAQTQNPCKQCEGRMVRPPNVPLPTFDGFEGDKGYVAKTFLRKLECYVASQRYTYEEALEMVVPCALDGPAGLWWESEGPKFQNWRDFLRSFKKEFGVAEYVDTFRQLVESRTQNQEEPLLDFINMIHRNYREFAPRAPDQEIVSCIVKQAHPECRILLKQKTFLSVEELKDVAKEVDETLAEMRLYRQSKAKAEPAPTERVPTPPAKAASPVPSKQSTPEPPPVPVKEAKPSKVHAVAGKVNPVSPNYRCEEKDVFLPPWAEKEQFRKPYGATFPKASFVKSSYSGKYNKAYPRPNDANVFRCYACGGPGHVAHNCRNMRQQLYKPFDGMGWDD